MARGPGGFDIGDEAVAVLHQDVHVAEPCAGARALATEHGVGIGGRGVRRVRALLTVKINLPLRPSGCLPEETAVGGMPARAVVGAAAETLHRSPGLDQRPVDGEVLGGDQALHLRPVEGGGEEAHRNVTIEQVIAVLREARGVPDPIVDAQPDEPSERQVEI